MIIEPRYPDLQKYISDKMNKAGISTNSELFEKVRHDMGHEFMRLIVLGQKLPEVEKAKVLAKALKVDFVEFICVVENARLRDRELQNIIKVVPVSHK